MFCKTACGLIDAKGTCRGQRRSPVFKDSKHSLFHAVPRQVLEHSVANRVFILFPCWKRSNREVCSNLALFRA